MHASARLLVGAVAVAEVNESQLLRTDVLPQLPPVSAIRTIVLLADTGLPDKYPCFGARCRALSPAACRGFLVKSFSCYFLKIMYNRRCAYDTPE